MNSKLDVQVSNLRGEAANWQQQKLNRTLKVDNLKTFIIKIKTDEKKKSIPT